MPTSTKHRTVLSLDSIRDECLAALDESGVDQLSVRGLAARLGAGVGSLYWHVRSKSELLDLAADRVVEEAVRAAGERLQGDPVTNVRTIAHGLFRTFDEHAWCPGLVVQNPARQPHSVRALDLVGRQLAELGLTLEQQFLAATTILGYVIGTCAQMADAQRGVGGEVSREAHLAEAAARWDDVDPEELPFLHAASAVLREHDDEEQFAFGLDLLLSGISALSAS